MCAKRNKTSLPKSKQAHLLEILLRPLSISPKMTLVRSFLMSCYSYKCITLADIEYADSRWSIYEDLIESESTSEFILKHTVFSMNLQLVDYFVLFLGFSTIDISCGQFLFSPKVLISLIDKSDILDSACKNAKFIKALVLSLEKGEPGGMFEKQNTALKTFLAHILTKFPDHQTMSFMLRKSKAAGGMVQRFPDTWIKSFYDRLSQE